MTTGAINILIDPAFKQDTQSELSATTQNLDNLTEAVVVTYVSWGEHKFNAIYNKYAYADASGTSVYRQYSIPSGMKSAYISHLEWSSGGYVDVHGVQSDGGLVFLRRINTHQAADNRNEGDAVEHDGHTISFAGSDLHIFSAIRFTIKSGRFHLSGLGFVPHLDGTEGTGLVNANQITQHSFAPTASQGRCVRVWTGNSRLSPPQ